MGGRFVSGRWRNGRIGSLQQWAAPTTLRRRGLLPGNGSSARIR